MSKKILIGGVMKELSIKPDMIYVDDTEPMIISDPYRGLRDIPVIAKSGQQLRRERRKKNRKKK